jgi:phage tail-like protein
MAAVVSDSRPEEQARAVLPPSMRGMIEGLPVLRHIADELPPALQEDDFCQRMVSALDEVVTPVYYALDCWDAYLDPQLAPEDFVEWLATWVGVEIDETWTMERRRQLIQDVVVLYRIRGTAAGLAAHIKLYCGVTPEIDESGECTYSQTADSPMPGSAQPRLVVRLRLDDPAAVKQTTLGRIVGAARPAHIPYQVELLVGEESVTAPEESAPVGAADSKAPGAIDLPGSERIELAPQAPPTAEEIDQPPEDSADGEPPAS